MPTYLPRDRYNAFRGANLEADLLGGFQEQLDAMIPQGEALLATSSDVPATPRDTAADAQALPPAEPLQAPPSPPAPAAVNPPLTDLSQPVSIQQPVTDAPLPPRETPGAGSGLDVGGILKSYAGLGYTYGGPGGRTDPREGVPTDCSGFVAAVWKNRFGVDLPAHTDASYNQLRKLGAGQVDVQSARPGDVVYYMGAGTGGAITHHMGIYAGDGKVLDMSSADGGGVKVRPVSHGGQFVILRDPRVNGAAPRTPDVAPREVQPTGLAEQVGGPVASGNTPDEILSNFGKQLQGMLGGAGQAKDQAVGSVESILADFQSKLGSLAAPKDERPYEVPDVYKGGETALQEQEAVRAGMGLEPGPAPLGNAQPLRDARAQLAPSIFHPNHIAQTWPEINELREKRRRGETLTPDEQDRLIDSVFVIGGTGGAGPAGGALGKEAAEGFAAWAARDDATAKIAREARSPVSAADDPAAPRTWWDAQQQQAGRAADEAPATPQAGSFADETGNPAYRNPGGVVGNPGVVGQAPDSTLSTVAVGAARGGTGGFVAGAVGAVDENKDGEVTLDERLKQGAMNAPIGAARGASAAAIRSGMGIRPGLGTVAQVVDDAPRGADAADMGAPFKPGDKVRLASGRTAEVIDSATPTQVTVKTESGTQLVVDHGMIRPLTPEGPASADDLIGARPLRPPPDDTPPTGQEPAPQAGSSVSTPEAPAPARAPRDESRVNDDGTLTLTGTGRRNVDDVSQETVDDLVARHEAYRAGREVVPDAEVAKMAARLEKSPDELADELGRMTAGERTAEQASLRAAADVNLRELDKTRKALANASDDAERNALQAKADQLAYRQAVLEVAQNVNASEAGRLLGSLSRVASASENAALVTQWEQTARIAREASRKVATEVSRTGTITEGTRQKLTSLRDALAERLPKKAEDPYLAALQRERTVENRTITADWGRRYRAALAAEDATEIAKLRKEHDATFGPVRDALDADAKAAKLDARQAQRDLERQFNAKTKNYLLDKAKEIVKLDEQITAARRAGDTSTVKTLEAQRATLRDAIEEKVYADLEEAIAKRAPGEPATEANVLTAHAKTILGNIRAEAGRALDPLVIGREKGKLADAIAKAIKKETNAARLEELRAARDVAKLTIRNQERLDVESAKAVVARIDALLKGADSRSTRLLAKDLLDDLSLLNTQSDEVAKAYRARLNTRELRSLLTPDQMAEGPEAVKFYIERLSREYAKVDWADPRAVQAFKNAVGSGPTGWQKFHTYRLANMLSSPATHAVNAFGGALETLWAPTRRVVEGLQSREVSHVGMAGEEVRGLLDGFLPAMREMLETARTGITTQIPRDGGFRGDTFRGGARNPFNLPTRGLGAADEFFRTLNTSGALRAEAARVARREGLTTDQVLLRLGDFPEVATRATRAAEQRTYTQALDGAMRHLSMARAEEPVIQAAIPFFSTIMNMAAKGIERTGGGLVTARSRTKAGDLAGAAEARAEATMGAALMTGFGLAALGGNLNGYGPYDRQERQDWVDQGNQPWSIRVGGEWRSINQLGAFTVPIGAVAIVADALKKGLIDRKGAEKILPEIATDIGRLAMDTTVLKGVSDLVDALSGQPGGGENYVESTAQTLVPMGSAFAAGARALDPGVKDPEGLHEAIAARFPVLSNLIQNKPTQFGEDRTRANSGLGVALPYRATQEKPNDVLQEYQRLRRAGFKLGVGLFGDTAEGVPLTRDEQVRYRREAGADLERELREVIQSDWYQAYPPAKQAEALQRREERVRTREAAQFRQKHIPYREGQARKRAALKAPVP